MRKYIFLLSLLFASIGFSQPASTSAQELEEAVRQRENLEKNSLVKNLDFKNIGPTIMSGRVVDLAVNPRNPNEFYVGYASGGVWHTQNNGTTFEPVLDNTPTQNVGCLAMDWGSRTLWVGTGEVNASRSSYAGIGLLKTSDNGKTWEAMGLEGSHHISRIIINPMNSSEVLVAVAGPLYSKSENRGVYKSFDGGKTWNKTLFVDDVSGIIEMDAAPDNFNIVYATAWDKDRKAWNFRGSGSGSAIYKSTDAGNTWSKVSVEGSGFPTGNGVGRIGVAVVDGNTVYAIHDNQARRSEEGETEMDEGLKKDDFKIMSASAFQKLDNEQLESFLRSNNFQKKYTAEFVKKQVSKGQVKPMDLAKYLEDANSLLFDTPVIGAEVYKSIDGGKSWTKTHEGYLDDVYYSYGYYFGKIHVDPSDADGIYIYGVPILKSKDGGKNFISIDYNNVHGDHHALWINPNYPGHLIDGNDGGVNISYDDGASWIKCNTPSVGQFYAINVDMEEPYNVYGGLQDNGVWVGSHDYNAGISWHQNGEYPYKRLMGGDGMQVEIDYRNSDIVYTGFQFGNYYRINQKSMESKYIQPKHELGETPYRFNWQTPIELSEHNQDILYLGANKLMRSLNQGDDWEAISPDLTQGGKVGNVSYGTLTTISESPFKFGLIYTGSDDGMVYVTQNGGAEWKNVSYSFPKDLWVSRVIASQHEEGRVYATLNGYRWDDFKPYVYVSDNYGATWKSISSNLPASPVNVIKEDPVNENILYLGTDNGAYVSFDSGVHWDVFSHGLPKVAFHDLVVHPKANDLVLGTHGRSIYIAGISLLQELSKKTMEMLVMKDVSSVRHSRRWGSSWSKWGDPYTPEIILQFYAPESGGVNISIKNEEGVELKKWSVDADKGINETTYDLSLSEKGARALNKSNGKIQESKNGNWYLPKGTYTVYLKMGDLKTSKTLEIK